MVRGGTKRRQQETDNDCLVKRGSTDGRLSGHGAPPGALAPVWDTRATEPRFQENSDQWMQSRASRPRHTSYVLKSATPSHTSWTAVASIKKPKILLMAPTALGPKRRTSGHPSKRTVLRKAPPRQCRLPCLRYDAALSTCAAKPMTTPMAPGPDISGMASG